MDRWSWPSAEPLDAPRLHLEPLRVDHAQAAAAALDDPGLHVFIGGSPASAEQLADRFRRQVLGHSQDGSQGWLNWMLRRRDTGQLVGTVQATLRRDGDSDRDGAVAAGLAWVVTTDQQGQGFAQEAAGAVVAWLRGSGVTRLECCIHPGNAPSIGVARALGLVATSEIIDGEVRWAG